MAHIESCRQSGRRELMHRLEHVDELRDAPAEQVEAAEDQGLTKVELLSSEPRAPESQASPSPEAPLGRVRSVSFVCL